MDNFFAPDRKITAKNLAAILLLAAATRFALLLALGPQAEFDTGAYLDGARSLLETGSFSEVDAVTGQLTPFAYRMPLFHAFAAGLMQVFGADIAWPLALANILFSVCAIPLAMLVLYAAAGPAAAVAAGYLLAVAPNSVFNSVLLLTDSMFAFFSVVSFVAGLQALKNRSGTRFFLWGAAIGLCVMIRPILQYYFIVPPLLLFSPLFKAEWRARARYCALVLLGMAVFMAPWVARNSLQLGFVGLETNQGVNTLVSTIQLVRPSTPEQALADPRLAAVRDIVARHTGALEAEAEARATLQLTPVEASAYLKRLGVEVILQNPLRVPRLYLRNAVNIVTSPSAFMELAARLSGKTTASFPHISVALQNRDWRTLAVNLGPRLLLALLFLVCAPLGVRLLWRSADAERKLAIALLLATAAYTVGLTSMVAGYDRYRLPLEPFLLGFAAVWLLSLRGRGRAPAGKK